MDDERATRFDRLGSRVVAGRYRVEALIGSGSTGHVFRATRVDSGAVVAIKLLHAHLGADQHATLRFRREAKVAAAVHHPNLVQGIEFGQDQDGTWFFAMELLVGRTLADLMRDDHPLPFARIHHLFRQTLQALEAAHTRGLVHRDLKPGNVIVMNGEPEVAKVCDFGISKLTGPAEGGDDTLRAQATTDGAICGTPAYMSPEQARGLPVDARTDIYAASVMLFEMVTGRLPFSRGTKMDVLAAHLTETPPSMATLREGLPPGLDEVVRRGLAKTREARYETAAQLRDALAAVFAGRWSPQPETVMIPPPSVPPVKPAARRPPRALWITVVATFALVAAVWSMRHRRPAAISAAAEATRLERPPAPAGPPVVTPAPASPRDTPAKPPADTPAAAGASPAAPPNPARQRRRAAPAAKASASTAPAPSKRETALGEAERLITEGRGKEACARGEEALRLEPSAPAVLRFLGRCYMRTGRRADAIASYRRYLEVAPDAPDAPLIRSIVQ